VIERDRIELDYETLAERTLALAGGLQSLGLEPGHRIALLMKNCAQYVELLYACWSIGACAIPINARLHPREVAFIVDDADARVCFITDDADTAGIDAARSKPTEFIDVDGADYRKLLRSPVAAPREESSAGSGAWLFYTSGTTGRPKGVILTHRNLLAMSLNYLADVDRAAVGDHLLHAAPMSHGSGLYIMPNVAVGATQLIPAARGFEVDEVQQILAYTPSTKFFAAPTMVMRLVDAYAELGSTPEHLKTVIYGGGPMYVADSVRAFDVLGPRLVQIYGQGESPMTITVLTAADHADDHDGRRLERLGSVGRAQVGVEVTVLDNAGHAVAVGEVGEVCVRGDTVMAGYLNNPQATAEALAGGWLHTGDLGRLDDTGYLTLVDRSKDLIISGGSNIYPREVEEVLLLHPAVKEAAVIGEPHPEWGEAVVAVLVQTPGHIPDEKELDLFCLEHIARFKRPKRYVFVDELPKNETGKVLKRKLRELIRQP
jgi:acyl-CoA synthetase (AMP-forming)/AMP-acid ligase II